MRSLERALSLLIILVYERAVGGDAAIATIDLTPSQTDMKDVPKRQISTSGPLRLACHGSTGNMLEWRFEGGAVPKEAKKTVLDKSLVLDFTSFNSSLDGMYECYTLGAPERARIRLFYWDDLTPLPAGFSKCNEEQASFCIHAKHCMVDSSDKKICVCQKDWGGEKCSDALIDTGHQVTASPSTTMIIFWVVLISVVVASMVSLVKRHKEGTHAMDFTQVPTTVHIA